jgi:peptidoglycan/xylan/chitin deacetylase (PgdA/CDA1 family)
MTLRSRIGDLRRRFLCNTHKRSVPIDHAAPVVSFSFDDFPRTAYTTGGSILKSFGVRGTYYAAPGLMNTSNALGDQLCSKDIESLLADGHELGSHTFGHTSCRRVSRTAFEQDALRGQDALQRMTGHDVDSFSYPYGHVSLNLKKSLGRQMASCRSIYGGINAPSADMNLLLANSLYGGLDQYPAAEALLHEAKRQRGWIIFYTHDVRREPSAFGCTPELLDKVVAHVLEIGLPIVPVGEVVKLAMNAAMPSFARAK